MDKFMDGLLKLIGGTIVVVGMVTYMLACAFAPFGIVWLVLNH